MLLGNVLLVLNLWGYPKRRVLHGRHMHGLDLDTMGGDLDAETWRCSHTSR